LYLVMVSSFKLIHSLASLKYAKVHVSIALNAAKTKSIRYNPHPHPLVQHAPPSGCSWGCVGSLTMATGALHCIAVCAAQLEEGKSSERREGKRGCSTPADCMQIA